LEDKVRKIRPRRATQPQASVITQIQ